MRDTHRSKARHKSSDQEYLTDQLEEQKTCLDPHRHDHDFPPATKSVLVSGLGAIYPDLVALGDTLPALIKVVALVAPTVMVAYVPSPLECALAQFPSALDVTSQRRSCLTSLSTGVS